MESHRLVAHLRISKPANARDSVSPCSAILIPFSIYNGLPRANSKRRPLRVVSAPWTPEPLGRDHNVLVTGKLSGSPVAQDEKGKPLRAAGIRTYLWLTACCSLTHIAILFYVKWSRPIAALVSRRLDGCRMSLHTSV